MKIVVDFGFSYSHRRQSGASVCGGVAEEDGRGDKLRLCIG
jgi:hypothetical protein